MISLSDLERLTSSRLLRLPPDYAPFPLVLPTCLRAYAQFLAERADTPGLFRVSGSERVIEAFTQFYDCGPTQVETVYGTFYCEALPTHITYTAYDVASTLKRFLSRLPGGILGSSALFDAFVSIHEQLDRRSGLSIARRDKLRARLIALAVQSIKSKCMRHMICAVFGLLNMVGRITELSPEDHSDDRPLHPDHELMDYPGLGRCIGPLLTREPRLDPAPSTSGRLPLSLSSRLHRRQRQNAADDPVATTAVVNRAFLAARVAEMLITYWRDVVFELHDLNKKARDVVIPVWLDEDDVGPPLSSDPDIGNLLVDSDAISEAHAEFRANLDGSPEPKTPERALSRDMSRQSSEESLQDLYMKPGSCQM
jgi:hypothetical protein